MLDYDKYYGERKSKESEGLERDWSSELKGQGKPCWDGYIWLTRSRRESQPSAEESNKFSGSV